MNGNLYPAGSNMKRKYDNGLCDDQAGPTPPKQYGYNGMGHGPPSYPYNPDRGHGPDPLRCGPDGSGRAWYPRGRAQMAGGGAFGGNPWCARPGPGMLGPPPRGFFHGRGGPPPPHRPVYNNYQGNHYRGWNHQGGSGHPPPLIRSSRSGSHQIGNNHSNARVKKESNEETSGGIEPGTVDESGKETRKTKRQRANSQNPPPPPFPTRPWSREDAVKALKVECETTRVLRNQSLIIRFPDPELSRDIVKQYHPGIQNVHFQVPSGPRYCFVQLSPNVNSEKAIKMLESIKFGTGRLTVEKKSMRSEDEISPESIDPYTLYIGNLPTNVNISTVKEKFPNAVRVDVGFAQKMRFTRYAFIRYNTVDEAIKAYKETHSLVLDSRSIIVRFRRQKGQIDLPGESKQQQPPKITTKPVKNDVPKESAEGKSKKVEEDEDEEKDEDDDDDDDEEDEEDDGDDDDDDEDDGEQEGVDDDDDDDEEEEGRRPLVDDDDDDDEDEDGNGEERDLDPPLDDDEDDDDPSNIFRGMKWKFYNSKYPF